MDIINRVKLSVLLSALCLGVFVMAESASVLLEEGIYAEQTEGDLDKAITIYTRITEQYRDNERIAAKATYQLGMCHLKRGEKARAAYYFRQVVSEYPDQEELGELTKKKYSEIYPGQQIVERSVSVMWPAIDPARLMPTNTLIYVEVGSPGKQIETIINMLKGTPLENPFALVGGGNGGRSPGNMLGAFFNPSMLAEFKKIRGFAFGVTGLAQNNPPFVVLLDPGESDALRGIIMAGLGTVGAPGKPVEGMDTLVIGEQIGIAFDGKVIIIANPLEQLEWSVKQYKGITDESCLASENKRFSRIDRKARRDNAVTIWADVDEVYAGVKKLIGEGNFPQEFRVANYFADFDNIDELVSYVSIEPTGISSEDNIYFKQGHRCLVYDIIRTPHIDKSKLIAAPDSSAALVSFALNESSGTIAERAQKVIGNLTGLDIGREIFANIEQVTIFAATPEQGADISENSIPVLPGVGFAITSRNPLQTRQILDRLLRGAEVTTTGSVYEKMTDREMGIDKYVLSFEDTEIQCHMAQSGSTTLLAFGPDTLDATLSALKGKNSVVKAGALGEAIAVIPDDTSKIIMLNVGQAIRLADAYRIIPYDGSDESSREAVMKLAKAFDGTCIQLRTRENPNHFNMRTSLTGMPPVDQIYGPMMQLANVIQKTKAEFRAKKRAAVVAGVVVMKTEQPPAIDGTVEELWASAKEYKLENVIYSNIASPEDFAADFKTMWDEENLYVLVDVTDDKLENNARQWFMDDCIEIFIDADNSKLEHFDDNDYQYHFDWDESNPKMDEDEHGRRDGVEFAMVTTETGYRTEIKFPWSTLGAKPSAGMRIGLEVHANDSDNGQRTKLSWRGKKDIASGDPHTWDTAELLGIVGWWEFDETEGNVAKDSSGGNHDGILIGDAEWTEGKIAGAIELDGDGDFVKIEDEKAFDISGQVTISCWVNIRTTSNEWAAIVTKGDSSWRLSLCTDQRRFHASTGDTEQSKINANMEVAANQWHHVAAVYDGKKIYLYIDGKMNTCRNFEHGIGQNDYKVLIGENEQQNGRYFDGLLDDVRIYNYALSAEQVSGLYEGR